VSFLTQRAPQISEIGFREILAAANLIEKCMPLDQLLKEPARAGNFCGRLIHIENF
jgi:hypothetical protein